MFKLDTDFTLLNAILGRVRAKYPELLTLISKIESVNSLRTLLRQIIPELNTVIAYMYLGGEHRRDGLQYWEYNRGSILDQMLRNRQMVVGNELNMTNLSSHLFRILLEGIDSDNNNLRNA